MKTFTDKDGKVWPLRSAPYEPVALVKFSRGGSTEYRSTGRSEVYGYEDPESFFAPRRWWAHDYATEADPDLWEGCLWLDTRAAVETEAGRRWVFRGPLPDASLAAGEISRITAGTGPAGCLDSVDLLTYVRGWLEHGARGGRIRGGQFVEEII